MINKPECKACKMRHECPRRHWCRLDVMRALLRRHGIEINEKDLRDGNE